MKIHLGCGTNLIHGWQNHDRDVDIRRRLPWRDDEADYIFAEHVIEHVTFPEGVRFLTECRRVLNKCGFLRLSFPDAERVAALSEDELESLRIGVSETAARCIEKTYLPLRTREDCLRLLFCGWGHQSAWTKSLGKIALRVAGFEQVTVCPYGGSICPEMASVDGHHRQNQSAVLETTVLEAVGCA